MRKEISPAKESISDYGAGAETFLSRQQSEVQSKSSTLRVAVVSDAIIGRNGVGTYYLDLQAHLRNRVDDFQFIGPAREKSSRLERFTVPMPGDSTQRLSWPRVDFLTRLLDQHQPGVIVLPTIGAFSYFALRYARRRKIPLAIVNHTNFDHLVNLYWSRPIARPMSWTLKRINGWLNKRATGVAAMDTESLEDARRSGIDLVRVMGTPIAPEFMKPVTNEPGYPVRRVLFVGRLAAEKRIDELLAAARELTDFEFTFAGDGPLRSKVASVAAVLPNVRYMGWLDRNRVLRVVDESDVLVLPSRFETFGTVALEALARRRHVLVSRDCGITRWPMLARGLNYIDRSESVASALVRMNRNSCEYLVTQSGLGWSAVRTFNEHALRTWLEFLMDVVNASDQ